MTDEVAKRSIRSNALLERRELPRALVAGSGAMRDAGPKFTPQHPGESVADYRSRLDNTILYQGFSQAIDSQVGKVLSKPVQLDGNASEQMKAWSKNVDGRGRSLMAFAIDTFYDAMIDGVSYILVDMPKLPEGASLADQRMRGGVPYWSNIRADQVLGWRTRVIGSDVVLSQVRIHETVITEDGAFGDKDQERIRVFTLPETGPVTFEVYVKDAARAASAAGQSGSKQEWFLDPTQAGTTKFERIPIFPIYTNMTGFFEGEPPLYGLAELNLEHWISSGEQRRALTFLRFAMLYLSGVTGDTGKVKIAPSTIIKLPQGGQAGYVEHSGSGVSSGFTDIQNIEKRMQDAGMQLRLENAGTVTATASAIDSAESNAALKAVANAFKETMQSVAELTARVGNLGAAGGVEMTIEFDDKPSSADFSEVLKLNTMGLLSNRTTLQEAKRRNIVAPNFDINGELERISMEGPPAGGVLSELFEGLPDGMVVAVEKAADGGYNFVRKPSMKDDSADSGRGGVEE